MIESFRESGCVTLALKLLSIEAKTLSVLALAADFTLILHLRMWKVVRTFGEVTARVWSTLLQSFPSLLLGSIQEADFDHVYSLNSK